MKKIPRLFMDCTLRVKQKIFLCEKEFHYIKNVLRIKNRDKLVLFNNTNYIFISEVVSIQKKNIKIQILEKKIKNCESNINIHLGQVISQRKKMDFTIQKSVELGVNTITPLFPDSYKIKKNIEPTKKQIIHWKNIIIAACQQCNRNVIPNLNDPINIINWCQKHQNSETKIILHPISKYKLNILPKSTKNICILIGSEIGFSNLFINEIIKYGFIPISLGPRILRTETACITILSILQEKFGDLNNNTD